MPFPSITLYRVENPFWLTAAEIQDGDLVISSGDANNDWSVVVPADRTPYVLNALIRDVTLELPDGADDDDKLLAALEEKFAGDENPFEDIKAFLRQIGISAKPTGWIGV